MDKLASSAVDKDTDQSNEGYDSNDKEADEAALEHGITKLAFYHGAEDMKNESEQTSTETEVSKEALVDVISSRKEIRTRFGYGITTASKYVEPIAVCAGSDSCDWQDRAKDFGGSWDDCLEKSRSQLVYSNDDMRIKGDVCTNSSDFKSFISDRMEYHKQSGEIHLPPRTIMVFENIVTTPKQDRDNDILRTSGAIVDPSMPLLWQHVQMQPIGKMLQVVKHTKNELLVLTALLDVSPLSDDAAKMVEAEILRISHGFRPIDYKLMPEKEGSPAGFDIKQFEIMEESLVSVPANTDAVVTMFSRGKFADPLVKRWAGNLYEDRQKFYKGIEIPSSCGDECTCDGVCGGSCGEKRTESQLISDVIDGLEPSHAVKLLEDAIHDIGVDVPTAPVDEDKSSSEPFGGEPDDVVEDENEQKFMSEDDMVEKNLSDLVTELAAAVLLAKASDLHDLAKLNLILSKTVTSLREQVHRLYL
jgi:hypothetical protein